MALKEISRLQKQSPIWRSWILPILSRFFTSVYKLLEDNGVFVFATQHPCFVTSTEKYMTPHSYYDIAIEGQPPKKQCYYHRSLQDIF